MRSELVTPATALVSNRFLLVHVVSTLTRKFHVPRKARVQDTINNSLAGLGEGKYLLKHFVRPDRSTSGVEVYDPNSTGQLKPEDALLALTTFTTGLPYFPPQPVHFNADEVGGDPAIYAHATVSA